MAKTREYSIAQRSQIITLVFLANMKPSEVANLLGIPPQSVHNIINRARSAGYNPAVKALVDDCYIMDKPRSGRPKVATPEIEASILASLTKDRSGREKSAEVLAFEAGISESSCLRLLKFYSFSKCKPTWKPGLTDDMRKKRLAFALSHRHWTLEDWKNIIWTDETSIILGHRRGANRVWRRSWECYDPTVIRRRFKNTSEFMFWGAFSYDHKGPCHIFDPESAAAKKQAIKELEIVNRGREQHAREEWELNNAFSRLRLEPRRGRRPTFKFTAKLGKLERKGKGGVDWYRYQKEILAPKLLPFAAKCKESRPHTLVMEDGAPAHAHFHQKEVYDLHEIQRLLWPGNSPDLNAVEPAWFWLKRRTTLLGAPGDRETAKKAWLKAWEELPQDRIQAWIERIPFHIEEIIRLEGGNEYKEGRPRANPRQRCRQKGILSFRAYLAGEPEAEREWENCE